MTILHFLKKQQHLQKKTFSIEIYNFLEIAFLPLCITCIEIYHRLFLQIFIFYFFHSKKVFFKHAAAFLYPFLSLQTLIFIFSMHIFFFNSKNIKNIAQKKFINLKTTPFFILFFYFFLCISCIQPLFFKLKFLDFCILLKNNFFGIFYASLS